MKTCILFALLVSAVSVNAQTLKELLYSGKLKMDTGKVIRKGDDLTSKIDTSTKKPLAQEKTKITPVTGDSSMAGLTTIPQTDSAAIIPATGTKDNNKIWKDYITELTGILKTEVLPSKKIKSGTYSVLIEYEIGLEGQITISNVSCSPESSFLEQQVKERLTLSAPQMTPLLSGNGKPRKAAKRQVLTLYK